METIPIPNINNGNYCNVNMKTEQKIKLRILFKTHV